MKHEKIAAVLCVVIAFGLCLMGSWLLHPGLLGWKEQVGIVAMMLAGGFVVAATDLGEGTNEHY